jgi:hypothetical protein
MEALLLRQTIGICYRDLKRRTDFRFLEAHMCVIFITFLTNHGGSTSDGASTAHGDSARNHTASPADILPISANGRRSLAMASMPVSPYPRHSGLRCRSIYRTGALICASDMPAASPSTTHPIHWQGFSAIATRFMRANAHGMGDR